MGVTSLAISPQFERDFTVFAGTARAGVYRSATAGRSWNRTSFRLDGDDVRALAVSPAFAKDETLFAATEEGVFRTPNGARAWTAVDGAEIPHAQCVLVSPGFENDGLVWIGTDGGGLLRSTDGGRTCGAFGNDLAALSIYAVAASPSFDSDRMLLAATDRGLFRSRDAGESWRCLDAHMSSVLCLAVARAGDGQTVVLAGSAGGGLSQSTDAGASWTATNCGLFARLTVSLLLSPVFPLDRTMFTGGMTEGVLTSRDAGRSWTSTNEGLGCLDVTGLAVSNDFAVESILVAATHEGIWRSANGGANWEPCSGGPESSVAAVGLSPDFARDGFAIAACGSGLWRSSDRAGNWRELSHTFEDQEIVSLAVSPTFRRDRSIFVCTRPSQVSGAGEAITLWRSADVGRSWANVSEYDSPGSEASIALSPDFFESGRLFLALEDRVLAHSVDRGRAPAKEELEPGPFAEDGALLLDLALSPNFTRDGTLFAATTIGLYYSPDSGLTWLRLESEGQGLPVLAVVPSPDFRRHGSVYLLSLGGAVSRAEIAE